MEQTFKKYGFHRINTEEELRKEIVNMYYMITSCTSDLYGELGNKTITFDDLMKSTLKYLKGDLEEGMYFNELIECAKEVYNTDSIEEILLKCLDEINYCFEEWSTTVIYSVEQAFSLLEIIEDKLVLPQKWFSPNLYKQVTNFLKTFNCKNSTYMKRKAFVNQGEFTSEQILEVGKKLKGVSLSTKFDFFPTPKGLASLVRELAEISNTNTILEPSAGTGSLLEGLNKENIQCVELSNVLASILEVKGYKTTNTSFEEFNSNTKYDRIIMNPPFGKRLDAKHILLAFNKYLKEGGILVAIHSTGILNATDKASKEFQELYKKYGTYQKVCDNEEFKNSAKGTNISTCITKFIK